MKFVNGFIDIICFVLFVVFVGSFYAIFACWHAGGIFTIYSGEESLPSKKRRSDEGGRVVSGILTAMDDIEQEKQRRHVSDTLDSINFKLSQKK